jgi:hypothetical protein
VEDDWITIRWDKMAWLQSVGLTPWYLATAPPPPVSPPPTPVAIVSLLSTTSKHPSPVASDSLLPTLIACLNPGFHHRPSPEIRPWFFSFYFDKIFASFFHHLSASKFHLPVPSFHQFPSYFHHLPAFRPYSIHLSTLQLRLRVATLGSIMFSPLRPVCGCPFDDSHRPPTPLPSISLLSTTKQRDGSLHL